KAVSADCGGRNLVVALFPEPGLLRHEESHWEKNQSRQRKDASKPEQECPAAIEEQHPVEILPPPGASPKLGDDSPATTRYLLGSDLPSRECLFIRRSSAAPGRGCANFRCGGCTTRAASGPDAGRLMANRFASPQTRAGGRTCGSSIRAAVGRCS